MDGWMDSRPDVLVLVLCVDILLEMYCMKSGFNDACFLLRGSCSVWIEVFLVLVVCGFVPS